MTEHGDPYVTFDDGGHCDACGDDELDLRGVKFFARNETVVLVCEGCIEDMNHSIGAEFGGTDDES